MTLLSIRSLFLMSPCMWCLGACGGRYGGTDFITRIKELKNFFYRIYIIEMLSVVSNSDSWASFFSI